MASRISHIHWLDRFFEPPSRELQQSARHPDAPVATKALGFVICFPKATQWLSVSESSTCRRAYFSGRSLLAS
jgi:hypothetical protein